MRYTGIALALLGGCVLLFCIVAASTGQPVQAPEGAATKADLMFPTIMGIVALVGGGVMYVYGGRGVISTRNPAVRN